MRTARRPDGTVHCFDGNDILQGWVSTSRGYWHWHPMQPTRPIGARRAKRLEALQDAAAEIDTLWPPPATVGHDLDADKEAAGGA